MKTQTLSHAEKDLEKAASALKKGELVAIPTETVYGLAGNAFDPKALALIFEAKARPEFDPLILHVSPGLLKLADSNDPIAALEKIGLVDRSKMTPQIKEHARALIDRFWPGPLTLILPKSERVPLLATSSLPLVGIRMPAHPLAQKLIDLCGFPIAAPSANRFGRISPTEAAHVIEELDGKIPFVLDGGKSSVGLESTVFDVTTLRVLRPGGVPREALEACLGVKIGQGLAPTLAIAALSTSNAGPSASPGNLESHYAPLKPLILVSETQSAKDFDDNQPYAFLAWSDASAWNTHGLKKAPTVTKVLSSKSDLIEAAQNLFVFLRELDQDSSSAWILAEACPEKLSKASLGPAIQDRLTRASKKR